MNMTQKLSALFGATILLLSACDNSATTSQQNTSTSQQETASSTKDSLAILNEAVRENPDDATTYAARAKYLYNKGLIERSLNDYNRALALDSNNGEYYLGCAAIAFDTKNYTVSKELLEEAAEKNPNMIEIPMKLANLYLIVQNHDMAFEEVNKALKIDLYHAPAYHLKGMIYYDLGNYKSATSSFRTAVEQDNEDFESWMMLAQLYAEANDDQAIDLYNNALKLDSNNLDALYGKAYYMQMQGMYQEAFTTYNKMLAIAPSNRNASYNLGYMYLEHSNVYDSAVYYFDKLINQNPSDLQSRYNLGLAYERAGQTQKAIDVYQTVLKLQPTNTNAAKGMSRLTE